MNVKPMRDQVLCRLIEEEERTNSGLWMPGMNENSPVRKAEVVAAGPGLMQKNGERIPLNVKEGDVVMLSSNTCMPFEVDRETLYMVQEREIMGLVEDYEKPKVEETSEESVTEESATEPAASAAE